MEGLMWQKRMLAIEWDWDSFLLWWVVKKKEYYSLWFFFFSLPLQNKILSLLALKATDLFFFFQITRKAKDVVWMCSYTMKSIRTKQQHSFTPHCNKLSCPIEILLPTQKLLSSLLESQVQADNIFITWGKMAKCKALHWLCTEV